MFKLNDIEEKFIKSKEVDFDFLEVGEDSDFSHENDDYSYFANLDCVDLYFKEVSQYPLISSHEEKELGKIIARVKKCKFIKSDNNYSIDLKKVFSALSNFNYSDECVIYLEKLLSLIKNNSSNKLLRKYINVLNDTHSFLNKEQINDFFNEEVEVSDDLEKISEEEFFKQLNIYFDYSDAKNKLIVSNLRLVIYIAKRFASERVDLLELINEGNIGLMRAVDKFDYSKDIKFSTYAYYWIKRFVLRYFTANRNIVALPPLFYTELVDFQNRLEKLRLETKKNYTAQELSEILDMDYFKVVDFLYFCDFSISLNQFVNDDDDTTLADVVEDQSESVEDTFIQANLKNDITYLFECLNEKEKEYILLRFGFNGTNTPMDISEICKRLKISRNRAFLLERRALLKLRNFVKTNRKAKSLKLYLS